MSGYTGYCKNKQKVSPDDGRLVLVIRTRETKILRQGRSGFRQKAPARKSGALTPSKRLKLSSAGPIVLAGGPPFTSSDPEGAPSFRVLCERVGVSTSSD